MTVSCDDIRRDAAGLASLAPGDAEREAAFRHAADCPGCTEALHQGESLMALIDALPAPEAPPATVLQRVAAAIAAETRRARALIGSATGVGIAVAWIVLLVIARHRDGGTPAWVGAVVAGLVAVTAGVAGARLGGWIAAVAVGFSALFALVVGRAGELEPGPGAHCMLSELLAAGIAFGASAWMRHRQGEALSAGALAAVAAAGALAGQAALNVVCGARDALPHLLAFHVGGVLIAALLGATLGTARMVRGIG